MNLDKFYKYYNQWREETVVLAYGHYDNENFKALLDKDKIDFEELVVGIFDVLNERDDFIALAFEKRVKEQFGTDIFDINGYMPLHDYCETVRIVLKLVIDSNFLLNDLNISEE